MTDDSSAKYTSELADVAEGKGKEKEGEAEGMKGKNGKEPPPPMVPFSSMFRYATTFDKFLMVFGSLAAVANGASMFMIMHCDLFELVILVMNGA